MVSDWGHNTFQKFVVLHQRCGLGAGEGQDLEAHVELGTDSTVPEKDFPDLLK